MDLVGPVGEPEGTQTCVHPGQREVVGDAAAAVGLDGAIDHPERHVGSHDLDGGDLGGRSLVTDRVHEMGRLERQETGLLDLDP